MSKIRIEELSVGYWVEIEGSPRRVTYIDGAQKLVRLSGKGNPVYIGGVQPIPLTAEILEKNGFVKNEKFSLWHIGSWADYPFVCVDLYGQNLVVKKDGVEIRFEKTKLSIHLLQHALRLAEIEKEIEVC